MLRELASAGGVVGLSPYVRMLKNGVKTTEQEFVDMISWTVERFGVEHVALGTDFYTGYDVEAVKWWRMGRWGRESPVPIDESAPVVEWPTWFQSPAAFPTLVSTMMRSGFTAADLDLVLGGNWLRLFEQTFDRPSA
ncbi:membrane dipeptidase [Saccharopolyspora spinosa]|uniref:membrane dipeptidase n=1 Tax=Saccharopolyspora spinosa TaxID=60894 RepID=UPI00376EFEC3